METRKEISPKCQLVLEMDGYISGQTLQHSNALISLMMRRTRIKEMENFVRWHMT
jgi:hypothetical protein